LMDQLRAEGVSIVPTLKLLRYELAKEQVPKEVAECIVNETVQEFGKFADAPKQARRGNWMDSIHHQVSSGPRGANARRQRELSGFPTIRNQMKRTSLRVDHLPAAHNALHRSEALNVLAGLGLQNHQVCVQPRRDAAASPRLIPARGRRGGERSQDLHRAHARLRHQLVFL